MVDSKVVEVVLLVVALGSVEVVAVCEVCVLVVSVIVSEVVVCEDSVLVVVVGAISSSA